MHLTEAEYDFILWYRTLTDKERLAVRRYVHLGDPSLLPPVGDFRERIDRLWGAPTAQGEDKRTFLIS